MFVEGELVHGTAEEHDEYIQNQAQWFPFLGNRLNIIAENYLGNGYNQCIYLGSGGIAGKCSWNKRIMQIKYHLGPRVSGSALPLDLGNIRNIWHLGYHCLHKPLIVLKLICHCSLTA